MSTLSNADFRTILMTPRRVEGAEGASNPMAPPVGKPKKKKKEWKPSKNKKYDKEESFLPEGYRDRAKERREDANPDYKDDEDALKSVGLTPDLKQEDKRVKELLIEKSKYLGGDIDHTHLVKGLDFALLARSKKEMEQKQKAEELEMKREQEEEKRRKEEDEAFMNAGQFPLAEPAKKYTPIVESVKSKKLTFQTRIAKMIHYNLFGKTVPKATEFFLPGRTAFVFDLSDASKSEVPTTIIRSKEDCVKPVEYMSDNVNDDILDQMDTILSYLRGTPAKRKRAPKEVDPVFIAKLEKEKRETEEKEKQLRKQREEEDIFADAGDYVPEVPDQTRKLDKDLKYFVQEPEDMEIEVQLPGGLQEQVNKAKMAYQLQLQQETSGIVPPTPEPTVDATKAMGDKARPRQRDKRESDPTFVGDNYAECYPGTYESSFIGTEGSDDEEDDLSKMDMGKKNKLHRWHFDSEEAWSSYNDKREALPKAAFQFGVKMSDGRKTKKNMGKSKEKKLDNDLKKINSMIKKRENMTAPNVPTAVDLNIKRRKME